MCTHLFMNMNALLGIFKKYNLKKKISITYQRAQKVM